MEKYYYFVWGAWNQKKVITVLEHHKKVTGKQVSNRNQFISQCLSMRLHRHHIRIRLVRNAYRSMICSRFLRLPRFL